jgi:hypothetical protein
MTTAPPLHTWYC